MSQMQSFRTFIHALFGAAFLSHLQRPYWAKEERKALAWPVEVSFQLDAQCAQLEPPVDRLTFRQPAFSALRPRLAVSSVSALHFHHSGGEVALGAASTVRDLCTYLDALRNPPIPSPQI